MQEKQQIAGNMYLGSGREMNRILLPEHSFEPKAQGSEVYDAANDEEIISIQNIETENLEQLEDNEKSCEPDFNESYSEICRDRSEIQRQRDINFEIYRMQMSGVQTVIDTFGQDRFLDALKSNNQAHEHSNLLDVISSLEPNSSKRNELYEKMTTDAQDFGDKIDSEFNNKDVVGNFSNEIGSGVNFKNNVEAHVRDIRVMDSLRMKVMKKMDFAGFSYDLISNAPDKFANLIFQDDETEINLRNRLAGSGGNIFKLSSEIGQEVEVDAEDLGRRTEQLKNQIADEIREISHEIYDETNDKCSAVLEDLEKIIEIASEMSDEAMKAEIQDVIQKAKQRTDEIRENGETEIKSKTKELKDLIYSINLDSALARD